MNRSRRQTRTSEAGTRDCEHLAMGRREVRAEPRAFAMASTLAASTRHGGKLLIAGARWLAAADRSLYATVAASATRSVDGPARQLSRAANYSRIWIAIAAGIAVAGTPDARRAALRGLMAIGVTSATVNLGIKSVHPRRRPDRTRTDVPLSRQVAMPS
jgi:hypothetical protein